MIFLKKYSFIFLTSLGLSKLVGAARQNRHGKKMIQTEFTRYLSSCVSPLKIRLKPQSSLDMKKEMNLIFSFSILCRFDLGMLFPQWIKILCVSPTKAKD